MGLVGLERRKIMLKNCARYKPKEKEEYGDWSAADGVFLLIFLVIGIFAEKFRIELPQIICEIFACVAVFFIGLFGLIVFQKWYTHSTEDYEIPALCWGCDLRGTRCDSIFSFFEDE
jgi:hypothetical protein